MSKVGGAAGQDAPVMGRGESVAKGKMQWRDLIADLCPIGDEKEYISKWLM